MGHPRQPSGGHDDDPTAAYVRSALHEAAQAHRPDRTAMVNRVAAGRAAPPRRTLRTLLGVRPVGAALAVAVTSALSVVAVQFAGDDRPAPAPDPPAAHRALTPVRSSPAMPAPATTGAQHSRQPSAPPVTSPEGPSGSRFLTSGGAVDPHSVDTWSQENVTVTSTTAIDALRVVVTVALTAETADVGRYTTAPNADVIMAATRGATTVTYTYVLRDGRTLAPGTYLFAAQFRHRSGRTAAGDSYTVVARAGRDSAELAGTFG